MFILFIIYCLSLSPTYPFISSHLFFYYYFYHLSSASPLFHLIPCLNMSLFFLFLIYFSNLFFSHLAPLLFFLLTFPLLSLLSFVPSILSTFSIKHHAHLLSSYFSFLSFQPQTTAKRLTTPNRYYFSYLLSFFLTPFLYLLLSFTFHSHNNM